jgi:hypothetical protein
MDDIRRQDMRLFLKELLAPGRIIVSVIAGLFFFLFWKTTSMFEAGIPIRAWISWAAILMAHGSLAWSASLKRRFIGKRFAALWNGCQDRLTRFEEVLKKLRREQIADLQEMPKTIRTVADSLYLALRRSDMIAHEVSTSEQGLYGGPPVWHAPSQDPQSKELYRIADKNIAEYKQRFDAVMAGVQRTEAQSAVYMTTLDTLRMKMLGYRLVGRSPEMSSQDFLEALNEAKLQLAAIDSALDELELGPYPTMIAAMPPPIPDDIQQRLKQ